VNDPLSPKNSSNEEKNIFDTKAERAWNGRGAGIVISLATFQLIFKLNKVITRIIR
jgi:hypothetical protein